MARRRPKLETPAKMLGIWAVTSQGVLVTTRGACLKGYELHGLDSRHLPGFQLQQAAKLLYGGLKDVLPEKTYLNLVMRSHGDYDDIFDAFEQAPQPDNPVLALQRSHRLNFLRNSNLRRHSLFLFVGLADRMSLRDFQKFSEQEYRRRVGELEEVSKKATSVFNSAGLGFEELGQEGILDLYYRLLNPTKKTRPPYQRREELFSEEAIRAEPYLKVQTIREHLIGTEMAWDSSNLRIGDRLHQVFTLEKLPKNTEFTDAELFYELDFDCILSVSLQIPSQKRHKAALDQRRRLANADEGRGGNVQNYNKAKARREVENLARLIEETGQRLVLCSVQVAVSAPNFKELKRRRQMLEEKAQKKKYAFYVEELAHDREFFRCLPGMSINSDRQLLLTSNNAVDLLPIFQEDRGDRDPVLLVKTSRGELFSFNQFETLRNNQNTNVYGKSGSGKSAFINMVVSTGILSNKTRGRLIVVDFAGEVKSSYRMLANLFGGQYVKIINSDISLNPFPPHEKAIDAEGKLDGETETLLTIITDLLLDNKGHTKDEQLYRLLIKSGIKATYKRLNRTPIYSDLLDTLKETQETDDPERLRILIKLLEGFLEMKSSKLFNQPSSANPNSKFLVLDLHGIKGLEPHFREAITFLVAHWVKQLAFDPKDDGYKYVILDEVAQLIRQPEMVELLDELFSTARAHKTSVTTITQDYRTFRESVLIGPIKQSTTQIYLDYGNDSDGRELVAKENEFTAREEKLFEGLKTVKGQYSQALIRTEVSNPDGTEKHSLASVVDILFSPFDYEVCTSDRDDRVLQNKFIRNNPNVPLHEVLEYIGYRWKPAERQRRASQKRGGES